MSRDKSPIRKRYCYKILEFDYESNELIDLFDNRDEAVRCAESHIKNYLGDFEYDGKNTWKSNQMTIEISKARIYQTNQKKKEKIQREIDKTNNNPYFKLVRALTEAGFGFETNTFHGRMVYKRKIDTRNREIDKHIQLHVQQFVDWVKHSSYDKHEYRIRLKKENEFIKFFALRRK